MLSRFAFGQLLKFSTKISLSNNLYVFKLQKNTFVRSLAILSSLNLLYTSLEISSAQCLQINPFVMENIFLSYIRQTTLYLIRKFLKTILMENVCLTRWKIMVLHSKR